MYEVASSRVLSSPLQDHLVRETVSGAQRGPIRCLMISSSSLVTAESTVPALRPPADDVVIYPGATILGGSTVIGKRAIIGGNVWITQSVEPNTTVTLKTQSNGDGGGR